jgi:small-conductance mechanosensitive channel
VAGRGRSWCPAFTAAAALAVAVFAASDGSGLHGPLRGKLITIAGAGAWFVLGATSVVSASARARDALWERAGSVIAGVIRLAALITGLLIILIVMLALLRVPVGSLVVAGTFTPVVVAIAAQQALSNLFAGIVLTIARPFHVGGHVRISAGALGGTHEGTVTEVGLAFVRLDTEDGPVMLPNQAVLAAAIDHVGAPVRRRGRRRSAQPADASKGGS